jgi:hypothetical protein
MNRKVQEKIPKPNDPTEGFKAMPPGALPPALQNRD